MNMKQWLHYPRELAYREDSRFFMARSVKSSVETETGVQLLLNGSRVDSYTKQYFNQTIDCIRSNFGRGSVVTGADGDDMECEISLIIDVTGSRGFRIRYGIAGESLENDTLMVAGYPIPEGLQYIEDNECITLILKDASLKIEKEPLVITMYDSEERVLCRLPSIEKMFRYPWKDAFPFGLSADSEPLSTFTILMDINEKLYGLGERFVGFNRRGQNIEFYHQDAAGDTSIRSYKNIPFYMSSAGYGVFINSSALMDFDLGMHLNDYACIFIADHIVDVTLFAGPDFKDILRAYSGVTGYTPYLPRWSYGLWMSRNSYESRQVVEEVAARIRKERIPCDVIHLDTYWFEKDWVCDLKFSKERFPEPERMFRELEEKGFKASIWQLPFVHPDTENYKEGKNNGYFVMTGNGGIYPFTWGGRKYALIDFTNEEAVNWYVKQIKDVLRMGGRVIKTDIAESAPVDGVYRNCDGIKAHQLYPLIYNKIMFEATQEIHGKSNGIVWARSTYAGGQRYPLVWSGDAFCAFEELAGAIRSALSIGLSGQPFWSHDIGGFNGRPSEELYVRWAQVGFLSSHSRCHGCGNSNPREPWAFGRRALEIFKKYAVLKYRLLPYIFSTEDKCVKDCIPFLRPLLLHHQEDPTAYEIADQYYFGDSMMVAPILNAEGKRKVYLPEGIWYDFWTGMRIEKVGWIDVKVPLDVMPIYVPAGAVIVFGPEMQYVDEKPYEPLVIKVYEGKSGKFRYVNGDDRFEFEVVYRNGKTHFDDGGLDKKFELDMIDGKMR